MGHGHREHPRAAWGSPTPSVFDANVHRATPSSHLDMTETALTGWMENRVFNQKGETAEEGL